MENMTKSAIFAADNSLPETLNAFLASGVTFVHSVATYIKVAAEDNVIKSIPCVIVFYEEPITQGNPVASTEAIDPFQPYEDNSYETEAYKKFKEMEAQKLTQKGDTDGGKSV